MSTAPETEPMSADQMELHLGSDLDAVMAMKMEATKEVDSEMEKEASSVEASELDLGYS